MLYFYVYSMSLLLATDTFSCCMARSGGFWGYYAKGIGRLRSIPLHLYFGPAYNQFPFIAIACFLNIILCSHPSHLYSLNFHHLKQCLFNGQPASALRSVLIVQSMPSLP